MSVKFCRLLKEAIVDETKAPRDYTKLILAGGGLINTESAVGIASIAKEEIQHRKRLQVMEKKYCLGRRR